MREGETMDLAEFKSTVIEKLCAAKKTCAWLERRGDVIQCPWSAVQEGKFYIIGFNPGVSENEGGTVRATTEGLTGGSQTHPLKDWKRGFGNLGRLADALDAPNWKSSLFVTNLFPDESPGVSAWLRQHHDRPVQQYVDAIWPLHQYFLSIVRPRYLIAHGQSSKDSAFKYLWDYLVKRHDKHAKWSASPPQVTGIADPSIKCFKVPDMTVCKDTGLDQLTIIGIRHLGRSQSRVELLKELFH